MMIGSLAFLGCPLRMVIRMAAGDLNAYVGFLGFAAGVFTGTIALKHGFSLNANNVVVRLSTNSTTRTTGSTAPFIFPVS